jgi:predicted DNA-binding transcriptional regulator AlpA
MNLEAGERLLPIRQILERYSVSDRTIDRWVADPKVGFPQPMVIQRRRFWRLAEIEQFERDRAPAKVA